MRGVASLPARPHTRPRRLRLARMPRLDGLLSKRVRARDAERAAKADKDRTTVLISVSWLTASDAATGEPGRVCQRHASRPFAILRQTGPTVHQLSHGGAIPRCGGGFNLPRV